MEDYKIREFIKNKLYTSGISRIEIERAANRVRVTINTAKPGMVIGKGGSGVEETKAELEKMTGRQVSINVIEVKTPDTDAQLVAENIASQLERRISFRRNETGYFKGHEVRSQGNKDDGHGQLGLKLLKQCTTKAHPSDFASSRRLRIRRGSYNKGVLV